MANLTRKELSNLVDDYESVLMEIYEVASDEEARKADLDTVADLAADALDIEEPDEEDTEK